MLCLDCFGTLVALCAVEWFGRALYSAPRRSVSASVSRIRVGGSFMKQHAFRLSVALLAVGLVMGLAWTTPANADNLYAKIRGTVVDPSGAVVTGARITATNVATGLGYNVPSDKNGSFEFLQLPIGDYSVKIEKSGFKSFTEGHVHLDLDQVFNLRVAMELGSVSDT